MLGHTCPRILHMGNLDGALRIKFCVCWGTPPYPWAMRLPVGFPYSRVLPELLQSPCLEGPRGLFGGVSWVALSGRKWLRGQWKLQFLYFFPSPL